MTNKEKERHIFSSNFCISLALVSFAGCLALGFFQNFFFLFRYYSGSGYGYDAWNFSAGVRQVHIGDSVEIWLIFIGMD